MQMKLYRVDSRKFNKGDIITPNTTFEDKLQGERLEVESMLNECKPCAVPDRKDCLFLFQELICALRFYSRYGYDGPIYEVIAIQPMFRGDMNKLDNILDIYRFTEDNDLRRAAVNEYWKEGTHTFYPCYEVLACSAQVNRIIEIDSEKFKKEMHDTCNIVECTPTYRLVFNQVYGVM